MPRGQGDSGFKTLMSRDKSRRPDPYLDPEAGYNIIITNPGPKPPRTAQVIRRWTYLSYSESKEALKKKVLKFNLPRQEAERFIEELKAEQAEAQIIYSQKKGERITASWWLDLSRYNEIASLNLEQKEKEAEQAKFIERVYQFLDTHKKMPLNDKMRATVLKIAKSESANYQIREDIPLVEAFELKESAQEEYLPTKIFADFEGEL